MATFYFGGVGNTPNGNWTDVSQWYSDPGFYCSCGCGVAGTPAGSLPTSADTVVVYNQVPASNVPTTYNYAAFTWNGILILDSLPAGKTWNMPVTVIAMAFAAVNIVSGTFNSTVTISGYNAYGGWIQGGTFNGAVTVSAQKFEVRGGVFNAAVNWSTSADALITGGTFGNISMSNAGYLGVVPGITFGNVTISGLAPVAVPNTTEYPVALRGKGWQGGAHINGTLDMTGATTYKIKFGDSSADTTIGVLKPASVVWNNASQSMPMALERCNIGAIVAPSNPNTFGDIWFIGCKLRGTPIRKFGLDALGAGL